MKIIIVGPAHPYRGGIADTNESFALSLQQLGHEVLIYTFKLQYPSILFPGKSQFSEGKTPKNLTIVRSINSIQPFSWNKTARQLRAEKADLIIFRYWTPLMAPALGSIAKKLKKTIKCITLCDNVIPHEQKFYDKSLTAYFCKQFGGFITFSQKVKEELMEFTEKEIMVHPHPINLNLGEEVDKKEARKHLSLKENGKYLLFFGLVRKYKGLDLLLEAMATKEMLVKDIKLIVAGEFYDDPEIYTKMIEDLKIQDKVIIHNQFIPTEEIKYYFSAADLIAQTYHTASQSGITQMALNFNKAVLVTNVGGLSEIVADKKSGYVVEKTPKSIASAIVDFYDNNREEAFSQEAKNKKIEYSWENLSKAVLEFSEKLG